MSELNPWRVHKKIWSDVTKNIEKLQNFRQNKLQQSSNETIFFYARHHSWNSIIRVV